MIGPILYDFKRAFIRISTLLFLIIFALGGIGLSYLSYNMFVQQYPQVNLVAVAVDNGENYTLRGLVYDATGRIIDRATLHLIDSYGNEIKSYDVPGNFTINDKDLVGKNPVEIRVETSLGENTLMARMHSFPNTTNTSFAIFAENYEPLSPPPEKFEKEPTKAEIVAYAAARLIIISKSTGEAWLFIVGINITNPEDPVPRWNIDYNFTKTTAGGGGGIGFVYVTTANYENLTYIHLATLHDYVGAYTLNIDTDKDILVLRLRSGDNKTLYGMINYGFMMPVEAVYAGVLASNSGLSLFIQFFPIVFLYLAYTLMAKPRSIGALEFVLARPITRWDIYFTRWVAGVLVAMVSAAVFIASLAAGIAAFLGIVFPADVLVLMYLGIVASMIVFYTLCYAMASSLRSGLYLAIAIGLYLLFALFWGLIVLIVAMLSGGGFAHYTETAYMLAYFNPLGSSTIATYYIQQKYGLVQEVSTVNPVAGVLAPIVWVTILFMLGYMVFKKINLSS